ncbi:MAG: phosphoribosylformylglycinamidine synthase I [Candidatus Eisenbacteria bacterium]|nr:phosphoribosylformylglycinamidine synthase I [Candidatus Eisenbacteria bacterium]
MRVAVIQFPGMNCEFETLRAVKLAGMDGELFRWNSSDVLSSFDAFVLPGGFSFQDRVRAGVVASRSPLMDELSSLALDGKPVLGICNGAQILVEAGLVPGWDMDKIVLGLGPNISDDRIGYYCSWVHVSVKKDPESPFTSEFDENEILPLPVAHAEGRFIGLTEDVERELERNGQVVFRYSTPKGDFEHSFPTNPNGSFLNAAGITNVKGNVLAFMPHPERALKLRSVPDSIEGKWGQSKRGSQGDFAAMEAPGPGLKIFESIRRYLLR